MKNDLITSNNQFSCMIRQKLFLCVFILFSLFEVAPAAQTDLDNKIQQCQSLADDKPVEAIELAEQLIETLDVEKNKLDLAEILGCMGWALAVSDQVELAKIKAYELEQILKNVNDSARRIRLLRRAGGIYHRIGDRFTATENYQNALSSAERLGVTHEKIPLLVNLGVLNSEIREHEKAIDNYSLALELMESSNDYRYQAPVLFNLAATLSGQKRYNESIEIYHQVEALIDESWPQLRKGQVYFGLASDYAKVSQLQKGLDYIEKSLQMIDPENEQTVFSYSVKIVHALLKIAKGNRAGALQLADEASSYYLRPENASALATAENPLSGLADLYEALGEQSKALEILKKSRDLDKKFQESFNKSSMAQMQARLADSKQREELASLKSENALNQIKLNKTEHYRMIMILAVISLVIILLLSWTWHSHTRRQLLKLSMIDPLTQLKNRRGIKSWLNQQKFPALPDKRVIWLIDLDNFKKINDEYGHDSGDTTLKAIGQSLAQLVNKNRCLGRWAGEEFILITQDLSKEGVVNFADILLKQISETKISHGIHHFTMTASIGVSYIKDDLESTWNRALSQADKALYVAKDRGRNCMAVATEF